MENKQQTDFNLNGTNLVQTIWKRKFMLTAITIVALVASIIVSFLIIPTFQSTAILIPAKASQASKDVFVPTRPYGITVFGEDTEVEHLLQVLSSESLRHTVIEKENLFEHYEIDPNHKHAWHSINRKFSSNISFSRSQFRTVKITVFDANPKIAAKIANTIVVIADSLMRNTKKEVSKKALEATIIRYNEALTEYYQISDSLSFIMSKGLLDLQYQAKETTKVYAEALASGNMNAANRVKTYMDSISKYGSNFARFDKDILNKSKQITDMQESIHQLELEAAGSIPSQFIIDWATPADKKAKPKKLTIIIVSTLSAFFFAVFLMILVDFFRTSIYPSEESEK
ncbi:MAG: Wzz/FepE/Etk N-terminal domain-containing protein [Bacteroidales bacterium]|nr:Wzz/FepE/Etk N-terminal domain-containing protein [Bacteroidales bacterium]